MLTSRLPHDRDEIAYCVSLLRHSPYWQGTSLTEDEVTDCWESLLLCGLGLIDIIHNSVLDPLLVNPTLAESNPHFERGHGCVFFDCFVTFEVMNELVGRTDDSEDPLMYVLRLFYEHRLDASKPCPMPDLGPNGEAPANLHGLSVGLYHPAIDFTNEAILEGSVNFNQCVRASMMQGFHGYRHDSWLNIVAGEVMVPLYLEFGNIMLRPYSGNAREPDNGRKKYMFFMAKDDATCRRFGVDAAFNYLATRKISVYRFLFSSEDKARRARLSKRQQRVAYMRWVGFNDLQVSQSLGWYIEGQQERSARAVNSHMVQANKGLQRNGYQATGNLPENGVEWLRAVLEESAVHEVREFIFPLYPWPNSLPSRRWR